jgi:hypothetical protein
MDWNKYFFGNSIKRSDTVYASDKYVLIPNKLLRSLCRFHYSSLFNNGIFKKMRKFWYSYFIINRITPINRIVLFNWDILSFDREFHSFLRENNPNIKIYLVLTATMELSNIYFKRIGISINDVLNMFDDIYTFDSEDTKIYGLKFLPLMYTEIYDTEIHDIIYDLCYVGSAKDRLDELHKIYRIASDSGLKCKFYITGVEKTDMKYHGIIYNQRISYEESISLLKKSKASLELIQKNQHYSTIRLCEAIVLNKKFITNNNRIVKEDLYLEEFIHVLDGNFDSLIHFINKKQQPIENRSKNKLLSNELFEIIADYEATLND